MSDESDDPTGWVRLTAQLAQMPELAGRLIAEHRDDGRGRCIRCTLPGRGTPGERWPCGPAALALAAQEIATRTWSQGDFTDPARASHKAGLCEARAGCVKWRRERLRPPP